jgi:hypothetical protein
MIISYGKIAQISGTVPMKRLSDARFYFAWYFYGTHTPDAVGGT